MSNGLGMRYAFLGPFETANLNADGWIDYCKRFNKSIFDVNNCKILIIMIYCQSGIGMFNSFCILKCRWVKHLAKYQQWPDLWYRKLPTNWKICAHLKSYQNDENGGTIVSLNWANLKNKSEIIIWIQHAIEANAKFSFVLIDLFKWLKYNVKKNSN